ncbi:MAG TPA: hypothetical protein VGE45_00495 [Chloroflexia bacterium]|jgi:hypothetical protein
MTFDFREFMLANGMDHVVDTGVLQRIGITNPHEETEEGYLVYNVDDNGGCNSGGEDQGGRTWTEPKS